MKREIIALEIPNIEINASFSTNLVYLAKTKATTLLLTFAIAFKSRAAIFVSRNAKAWKFKRALLQ